MAKRGRPAKTEKAKGAEKSTEKTSGSGHNMPHASIAKSLISQINDAQANVSKASGEIGALMKQAEDRHSINRKALKLVASLAKASPEKVNDFLRCFDWLRVAVDLNKLAGTDMFAGAVSYGEKPAESEGDRDLRPRHLRQKDEGDDVGDAAAAANAAALSAGIKALPETAIN